MNDRDKWLKIRCSEIDKVEPVPDKNGIGRDLIINLQGVDYEDMLEFLFAKDGYKHLFPHVSSDMAYDLVCEFEEEFTEALNSLNRRREKLGVER